MKILVFAGSPRCDKSNSMAATLRVLKRFGEYYGDKFDTEIITEKNTRIENCCGCYNCFFKGLCSLEKQDDVEKIKQKMLDADIIVFATPIYAINVTVFMNKLFQRLSSWFHLMPLIGKKAVLVTSSYGNGIGRVNTYMRNLVWGLGMRIVAVLNVVAIKKSDLENEYNVLLIEKCAKLLSVCIRENTIPELFNVGLEEYFSKMKNIMMQSRNENYYEYVYWKKSGLFACDSFEDAERLVNEGKRIMILED